LWQCNFTPIIERQEYGRRTVYFFTGSKYLKVKRVLKCTNVKNTFLTAKIEDFSVMWMSDEN
jgi:hypothetical protein